MIATKPIIFMTAFFLIAFAVSTLLLYIKYPKNRGVKLFAVYFCFFALGLLLTTLRNMIPDFLSIQLGLTTFAFGYIFLYMGLRHMLGFESKWHIRYYIPIVVFFIGIYMFTYIHYDLHMRIIIFSFYIMLYTLSTAWLFWSASAHNHKRLNQIAALLYVVIAFIFLLRAINATVFSYQSHLIHSNTFIINAPYILLNVMSIVLIINSNVYLRSGKKYS